MSLPSKLLALFAALAVSPVPSMAAPSPTSGPLEPLVQVPAHEVGPSALLSPEAKAALVDSIAKAAQQTPKADIAAWRAALDAQLAPTIALARTLYPVSIAPGTIAGVYVETIQPAGGVTAGKGDKVLLELHGGGFMVSARTGGQLEAIPVAALGGYRVIAVDYRQYPEARYPAATDDVVAVYRTLLKTYDAKNIGIFGCSAGGLLTAQTTARLIRDKLPVPGAISIACSGAGILEGDSSYVAPTLTGTPPPAPGRGMLRLPYFADADVMDPMVSPVRSPAVLAKFPPTLFVTGTRDFLMSAAVFSNEALIAAGASSKLRVFEGLPHGFHTTMPQTPEARAANMAIVVHFNQTLGASPRPN